MLSRGRNYVIKCENKCWRKTILISNFLLTQYTQVSVLTDQVEAQGAKISDLESSLVEHQHKLDSTEEMLQQVHSFTNLRSKPLMLDFLNTKCLMDYWSKIRKL